MAVLSPDETEVVTFNVNADGNDTTLQLNCSGVGSLTWYRGTPPEPVNEIYITLLDNNLLMLTISPVRNNTDADGSGLPYFCIANNTLGQARSRTVLVKYACELLGGGREEGGTCIYRYMYIVRGYVWTIHEFRTLIIESCLLISVLYY